MSAEPPQAEPSALCRAPQPRAPPTGPGPCPLLPAFVRGTVEEFTLRTGKSSKKKVSGVYGVD